MSTKIVPKKVLTPDEVNDLMKDWFVRSGETFTAITPEDKLAWEPESGTYSDFLTKGDPKFTDLMKYSYGLAKNMVAAMAIPTKVQLMLHESQSATDGRRMWLCTKVFDNKGFPVGEQIDTFLGHTVHEGSHLLYTDFAAWNTIENKLVQTFANVYEDERIEMLLADDKPGLIRYIEKGKYYSHDVRYHEYLIANPLPDEITSENVIQVATDTMLRIIRFPRNLRKMDFEILGDHLQRIKEVVTPYPTSTAECIVAAQKTVDILKELIEEKREEEQKEKEKQKPKEEQNNNPSPPPPLTDEEIEKMISKFLDDMAEMFNAIPVNPSEGNDGKPNNFEEQQSEQLVDRFAEILAGVCEELDETYFNNVPPNDDKEDYDEIYSRIAPFIGPVKKSLKYHDKDYKVVHKGQRNGFLDTNKLAEAVQGVTTVYETYGQVKTDEFAICLLVDESGSMGGRKIKAARECAVLLYEAFKGIKSTQLFVYGHSADERENGKVEVYNYFEPGNKPKGAIASMRARGCNRDGDAILRVAQRVRRFTKRKCLMFVMSDGQPNAHDYSGAAAITDTRNKVQQVERMNFDVCQIAIEHTYNPEEMFRNHVILTDLNSLAFDLTKMIKQVVLKTQKIQRT